MRCRRAKPVGDAMTSAWLHLLARSVNTPLGARGLPVSTTFRSYLRPPLPYIFDSSLILREFVRRSQTRALARQTFRRPDAYKKKMARFFTWLIFRDIYLLFYGLQMYSDSRIALHYHPVLYRVPNMRSLCAFVILNCGVAECEFMQKVVKTAAQYRHLLRLASNAFRTRKLEVTILSMDVTLSLTWVQYS